MKIALSNDHAGFILKPFVLQHLRAAGHHVVDVGTQNDEPVDFPVMTQSVTSLVVSHDVDRGILVCGSGVGASIAANKVRGIRAAVIHDTFAARQSVEHDDVNVACLGAWIIGERIAADVLDAFLGARFDDTEDVRRRVAQITELEADSSNPALNGRKEPADRTELN
ncbi:RpiB/LacA/LacB family sugar-phosphate isomerase [Subtercola frigoramans]|uniref:Ribose 5-phosphate isomerase B n=1 Tax=Subtercola frigoramans TaxID=120298 RepID=A0ABS2L2H9_9MICO|nr:RpiB/LacA/LacB family sugar-phosphate isomerase [Subtercola frigoramans]MBM7471283.1 ribose 5-phosphate isomerase B [Subtercola frigoramans]